MFIGHLAAGFALKSRVRGAPLGPLLAGTALCDVVFAVLGVLGIERVAVGDPPVFANWDLVEIGYSHSLLMSLLYGVVIGYAAARWLGSRAVGVALGLAIFSHFILDVLSHRPDMPLIGLGVAHDVRLGTNLALHPLAFFVVELGCCLLAWYAYDRGNRRLLATFLVLMALWANNVFGFALPPQPPPAGQCALTLAAFTLAGAALWWAARPTERAARV